MSRKVIDVKVSFFYHKIIARESEFSSKT